MKELLLREGYADLGVMHPDKSVIEAAQYIANELNVEIFLDSEALTVNSKSSKPKNTYAGNYGFDALPLHTDLAHWYIPPRYIMLRCVVPDPQVTTLLLHHREILKNLDALTVDRALFRPRKRLDGKMFLLRLCDGGIYRWDQLFLVPENLEAEQVKDFMGQKFKCNINELVLDKQGTTILIDNWSMLHGRSMVKTIPSPRHIERVYFEEKHA
jgi:hypothetical protein